MADEKSIRVLVVDDEKISRDFLIRLLSLQAVNVKAVENGESAIEAVKEEKFDLVFLDIRMPGMNGIDTLKALRKIRPDLQCVLMTGFAVDDLLEEAKKEGEFNFMKKPFDINQIRGIIKDYASKLPVTLPVKILVVDDDKNILNFFEALLREKGCDVTSALSGKEAMALLDQKPFDLVFLDIVLNDSNGIDLYSKIKKARPLLEVILMTGYTDKKHEVEKLDIKGCLYKPFEIDKIFSEVKKVRAAKK